MDRDSILAEAVARSMVALHPARAQVDLTTKSLQKQRLGSWLVQAKAWLSGDWWL